MADILTSIHGREYGLDKEGQPIWNLADGSQMRLTKAELAAMQGLVSGDGINGIGQTTTYDGGTIPDPRRHAQIVFSAIDGGATTDFLPPQADRRMVIGLASGAATSSITESAGGRTVTVMPDAAAAGLRWADEHASRGQTITTTAAISAAVLDIQGA